MTFPPNPNQHGKNANTKNEKGEKNSNQETPTERLRRIQRQENLRKIKEKEIAQKIEEIKKEINQTETEYPVVQPENQTTESKIDSQKIIEKPKREIKANKFTDAIKKIGEKIKRAGRRAGLWTMVGLSTATAVLPNQVKGAESMSYEDEKSDSKLPGKPGEVHPKYTHLVRNAEGKWPMGSIPYNEELKAGLYNNINNNSISFEQAKKEKDFNDSRAENQVKNEVKGNAWDKYDKHPDLFKKIPEEKYKNITDYFDRYYSSDFTKEKLKSYFPEISGIELEQKVNEILTKAKEDIHRKKFYIVDRERMSEAEKVEPLVSYFSEGYAGGLSLGEVVIFSPDIQEILLTENISHEMGHHVGLVEEDESKKDFLDTSAKKRVQFKYTPIPLLGRDLPYPLSIRNYVLSMPGEMKSFLDELRARYNLDPNKKITKEDIQKRGVINNYRWRQLKEAYTEDDLINMMNEIVENKNPEKNLNQDNTITEKPEGNLA